MSSPFHILIFLVLATTSRYVYSSSIHNFFLFSILLALPLVHVFSLIFSCPTCSAFSYPSQLQPKFPPKHYSWFHHYFIYLNFNCRKLIIWEEISGMKPGAARRRIGFALADGLRKEGRRSLSLTLSATPWHLSYNNDE